MSSPEKNFKLTKYACYYSYVAMAAVFILPSLLFVTFHETYGISYTLLGTLILINFLTQLSIDLLFSFFSEHFNIKKSLIVMPLLTMLGLLVYALTPTLFPQTAYAGLVIGTLLFSVSAGLNEVLMSPIIAALPSDHHERDMSILHSLYAWGVLLVVAVSSLFFALFGTKYWMILTAIWAMMPIGTVILFSKAPLPDMNLSHTAGRETQKERFGMLLCVACIFFGSAAENTMTNWVSGFLETALKLPKAVGDILGLALFITLLGFCRILYAKYGKNIGRVIFFGMIGAIVCYLAAGLSPSPIVSLIACVLCGFCTSMLWPGMLMFMEEKLPTVGVAAYALMSASGDFGASLAPQLAGIVVDTVTVSGWAMKLGETLALTPEQIGMKTAMLISAVFPIIGLALIAYTIRYFAKK